MNDVPSLLARVHAGDARATDELFPIVYSELRRLAAAKMASERCNHTLQATALVHEAYVRLVDSPGKAAWNSKGHFLAAAAEAMRRILVEHARAKSRRKRGGDLQQTQINEDDAVTATDPSLVIEVHEALGLLEDEDPRLAEVVKLRYFTGLSFKEIASVLEIAPSTAAEDWVYAKSRLKLLLRD